MPDLCDVWVGLIVDCIHPVSEILPGVIDGLLFVSQLISAVQGTIIGLDLLECEVHLTTHVVELLLDGIKLLLDFFRVTISWKDVGEHKTGTWDILDVLLHVSNSTVHIVSTTTRWSRV